MNNFENAAEKAADRGERDLARRIRAEGSIALALVSAALERGFTVSVFDCEEWTVKRSTNKAEIVDALFTTDDDTIRLHTPEGERVGSFWLVYGNCGYDVVSDYTANDACESIYNDVIQPLADKLEDRLFA